MKLDFAVRSGLNLCHVWKMYHIIHRIIALALWLEFFFSWGFTISLKSELKLIYRNESLKKKLGIRIQLNLFPVVFMTIAMALQIPPVVKAYTILWTGWISRLFFFFFLPVRINGHLQPLFFITESFSFSRRWRVIFCSDLDKLPSITLASVSHCSPWDCGHRQRRPQPLCPCSAWDFPLPPDSTDCKFL